MRKKTLQSFYRWKKKDMRMGIADLRRLRQECLNQHWFASLEDARIKVEAWRVDYDGQRPHTALGNQTPEQFEPEWQLSGTAQKGIFKPQPGPKMG